MDIEYLQSLVEDVYSVKFELEEDLEPAVILTKLCFENEKLANIALHYFDFALSRHKSYVHVNITSKRILKMIFEIPKSHTKFSFITDKFEVEKLSSILSSRRIQLDKTILFLAFHFPDPNNHWKTKMLHLKAKKQELNPTAGLSLLLHSFSDDSSGQLLQ